ncbi:hypothetical protein DBP12_35620 [Streptomyces sp. CS014]|nr:hypothetical protein DBP12_35620 [Streptomyces sp. CS014]
MPFALHSGAAVEHLPQELGVGSAMTCCRRSAKWSQWADAGVRSRLHEAG